ncbi:hypothetical protein KP509_03G027300 [Ceratopteris richardii]|uniref:Uncharacterized protein n=1 Tax=Ceratopteris richardii TaxID=49495 RepID=A0A8T2UY50_CERRI|nr:hypothetical protein KP509_03G027300 [Ceratopteris richardii]
MPMSMSVLAILRKGLSRGRWPYLPRRAWSSCSSSNSKITVSEGMPTTDLFSTAFTVWGANTNVGKTLISAGLSSSVISCGDSLSYLKPLQTGFPKDSDSRFVVNKLRHTLPCLSNITPRRILVSHSIQSVSPAVLANSPRSPQQDSFVMSANLQKNLKVRNEFYSSEQFMLERDSSSGEVSWLTKDWNEGMKSFSAFTSTFRASTIWSWFNAVSPHIAAAEEGLSVSEAALLQEIEKSMFAFSKHAGIVDNHDQRWTILETAGGVASPGPDGTLQCDLYRLPVFVLPSIPEDLNDDLIVWFTKTASRFNEIRDHIKVVHKARMMQLQSMQRKGGHYLWWPFTQHSLVPEDQITVIDARVGDNFMIYKNANDSDIIMPQFDACASWWTQGPDLALQLELARQVSYASGRFGHVMLPENVYEPALQCAEFLIESIGKDWASRVYYSDNGSTAVEIAIKMAFRKYLHDHQLVTETDSCKNVLCLKVLALRGSYHGDTLGAQDAQAPSAYTGFLQQPWYEGRGLFLDPPHVFMHNRKWHIDIPKSYIELNKSMTSVVKLSFQARSELFDKGRDSSELAALYKEFIRTNMCACVENCEHLAALIIEPVIHGAGGMTLIDPLFQRILVNECKRKKIPVIFDEVFAGCWRLGVQTCIQHLGCTPDIGCYSKLLTGGVVPLAVTLASSGIFESFKGDSKLLALLHGHSYSGHAIGCQAALTALQWLSDPNTNPNLLSSTMTLAELWDPARVSELSAHPEVQRVIALGTVFALELKASASESGYGSLLSRGIVQALREDQVYTRPLGNVIYFMCGPTTPPATCTKLLDKLSRQLDVFTARKHANANHACG